MKPQHYLSIFAAVVIAAINAYLSQGGPSPIVGGLSLLAGAVSVLSLFLQPPPPPPPPPPPQPPQPGPTAKMASTLVMCGALGIAVSGCSAFASAAPVLAADAIVLADDLCALEAQQTAPPGWEVWLCKVEGKISGWYHVIVPKGTKPMTRPMSMRPHPM